jgi:NitT/TauT family transport system ATP-binding protein
LIAALAEAAQWCDEPKNRAELARILSAPAYLDLPAKVLLPALTGRFESQPGTIESVPDFHVFSRGDANAPTAARAATLQNELVACGLLPRDQLSPSLSRRLFREDLYRKALSQPVPNPTSSHVSPEPFVTA